MILMIDNYDSFTYNLVQYLGELGADIMISRNDEMTVDQVKTLNPERIIISPGPGGPKEAGISLDVVKAFSPSKPILGVCLGHQVIGEAFGGEIVRAKNIMHGKTSEIHHDGKGVFAGLKNPFTATRYHSLIIKRESVPDCLEVCAWTKEDEIMGVRHRKFNVHGVQFHPESILTEDGKKLLSNFLKI